MLAVGLTKSHMLLFLMLQLLSYISVPSEISTFHHPWVLFTLECLHQCIECLLVYISVCVNVCTYTVWLFTCKYVQYTHFKCVVLFHLGLYFAHWALVLFCFFLCFFSFILFLFAIFQLYLWIIFFIFLHIY